jgi:hypothetical protein
MAMSENLDIRLVTMVSARELQAIEDFQFGQRIGSRGEATRQILAAGLEKLGLTPEPKADTRNSGPPALPDFEAVGRPHLGQMILPWMQRQGKREYEMGEVLEGVFNETLTQHATGRDQVIARVFKAIGWRAVTTRKGGVSRRTFVAPEA